MNEIYGDIKDLFTAVGIPDFTKLPDDKDAKGRFAKLFKSFNDYLDAAKVQLFSWGTQTYDFDGEPSITMDIDEQTYLTLALRYKELFPSTSIDVGGGPADVPYDICTHLTEINTDKIDADYMNSRFTKYMRELAAGDPKAIEVTLNELHKSFASLTQAEQKAANLLLHDVQTGYKVDGTKSFRELLTERMIKDRRSRDLKFADAFGIDVEQLQAFFSAAVNEVNLNEFDRFETLVKTVDRVKAGAYFTQKGETVARPKLLARIRKELRTYILSGGFDI
jgi:type I restriction enzyme R subunit